MKKILFLILVVCVILSGCGNKGNIDLSKYDKVALTTSNIQDYIDVIRISGSFDYRTAHLTYQFESKDSSYYFEDVKFDSSIIECYNYYLMGIEVSDNIYVERKSVSLDSNGNSKEFSVSQSVEKDIKSLCSGDYEIFIANNVKGYVYVPWDI